MRRGPLSKKEFYRKLRLLKKAEWSQRHAWQHHDHCKFHFVHKDQEEDNEHARKNPKGEHRVEQRLRNRVAAQESRERHRFYVEELENKLKFY